MKSLEQIEKMMSVSNKITQAFNEWDNNYTKDSRCDKKGFGFNLDERFSAHNGITVRVDNWKGYYGNSGCSTFIGCLDEAIFNKHLHNAISKRFRELMFEVATTIREEAATLKEQAKKELEEKLKKVESL